MKHLLMSVGIFLTTCHAFSQTEQINQQKYWKFRDQLRENFVKISGEAGGSIVARGLKPFDCWDNINNDGVGYGEMHFGDGMIRQGYYLGLLATEYKLLKDAGQDTQGVLNELYYALTAINRNDKRAEFELSEVYGFFMPESLNGFYMREDIPAFFAKNNWEHSKFNMYCENSPHFKTNNADHADDGTDNGEGYWALENSYQNTPSMDQLSSLMVGFRLVHKMVDNVYVQPNPEVEGYYIVTEVQAIVNRMMTYLNEHNWMMIDVNGWPVNNGGGDCIWAAYPLYLSAYIITNNQYDTEWTRRVEGFYLSTMQYCITGFGTENATEAGQLHACNVMNLSPYYHPITYNDLLSGSTPGFNENQNESSYQQWLSAGPLHGGINLFYNFWLDPEDDLNDFWGGDGIDIDLPTTAVKILDIFSDNSGADDDNFGILSSNLAAASGVWSSQTMYNVTQTTGNIQIDLINALLQEESPVGSSAYYKAFLDEMPLSGPYNFTDGTLQAGAPNNWASEDRWTFASEAYGTTNKERTGVFNGIDYMLFHNLYRLAFPQNQSVFTQDSNEECFCNLPPALPVPGNATSEEISAINSINAKLTHVSVCTENIFESVENLVIGNFNIEPYFSNYDEMGIYTNKFETENAAVLNTGYVAVNTPFIICNNSTLNMQSGSVMKIIKRHVSVNSGSTIDLSGELYVQPGTELRIKSGGHLILRPGSKLILHENCKVIIEQGASLTYYQGATIYTKNDDTGKLIIKGSLNLENNAVFSIDHSLSTSSGLIVFEGKPQINAKPGASVNITAKNRNDVIIKLMENTVVKFADPDLVNIKLADCGIDLSSNNSWLRFEQPVDARRSKFFGTNVRAGQVEVTDENFFLQSDFVNAHISAILDVENNDILRVTSCNFSQTLPYYGNGTGILVQGRGYAINSSNFTTLGSGNGMIESYKLTVASTVSGCNFADVTGNNTIGNTAIYDVSNVEIRVTSSNFNYLHTPIDKTTGVLTLRCDNFNNSYNNSVTMRGGLLNMSIASSGGYNTFTTMTGSDPYRCHILLEKALISMNTGSNYLRDVPVNGGLVRGTLQTPCTTTSGCLLDFSGNQWNPISIITPASSRFNIRSSNNIQITVNTIAPMQKASCGSLDVITGIIGVVGGATSAVVNQIPSYYSQITGQTKRLDEGIQMAIGRMTALNDGVGNDLEAIALFDEIFRSNISYLQGNAVTQKLLTEAKRHMKLATESAMTLEQITPQQNVFNFEGNTEDYVNSLNKLTYSTVTGNTYFKQFYNELDKAQIFRAIGQPQKSLEMLTELESCGLDLMEQQIVNREKKYALRDIKIGQIGSAILDTIFVPDTSTFINPTVFGGDYHFGSFIQNLNSIDYQNCAGSKSLYVEENPVLEVFPNPSSEEVTIRLPKGNLEGTSEIIIYQADGRILSSKIINPAVESEWTFNVEKWMSGAYQYVYISPEGMRYTGTFVVM